MIVKATNLVKVYKKRRVVNEVSVEFSTGEIVGLLGPNGAGKTTTFYMITGLIRPTAGQIELDGKPITRWPMHKRARSGIGYLAQESSVFRRLTVEDNLRLVLEARGFSRKIQDERIDRLAEELSIKRILSSLGGVLSGGERRRVEIARAMATEPHFILLDEPFTGIDPVTIEELQHIIDRLAKQGIGILITDHNVDATLNITDRNYILVDGQIIATGNQSTIRANDAVRKNYLGQGYDQINKDRHSPPNDHQSEPETNEED
ncbi:LPS export ABC transporter ATP-binding protein [bacterium]|jgi:lipopolysaccharide export system ATP-binding protein|nr:LPS export ABC transporter ATP-binding protein [bacterium]